MKEGKEFLLAVDKFAREISVPREMILDPSDEYDGNKVQQFAKESSMALKIVEAST